MVGKIKPLLPSLREKKRYLVYEIISDKKIDLKGVKDNIKRKVMVFMGELGYSKAGIMFLDKDKENKGLIRVNSKYLDHLRTALILIKDLNNQNVLIKTIGVSGMLNKAINNYLM